MTDIRPGKPSRRSTKSVAGDKRTPFTVYLNHHERMMLTMKAENSGVSMSKLLVDSAMIEMEGTNIPLEVMGELRTELASHIRQLAGIANNLNQLTHHAHATQDFSADTTKVIHQVWDFVAKLDEKYSQIGGR